MPKKKRNPEKEQKAKAKKLLRKQKNVEEKTLREARIARDHTAELRQFALARACEANVACDDLGDLMSESLSLSFYRSSAMSSSTMKWAFELIQTNMKSYYESAADGWNKEKKILEMKDSDMRFIVVTDSASGENVAFLQFMFTMEKEQTALYIYEVMVSPHCQGQGIGSQLTHVAATIARTYGMEWLMLTVFKSNERAISFYKDKNGYLLDETSPLTEDEWSHDGEPDYEILSKRIWDQCPDLRA